MTVNNWLREGALTGRTVIVTGGAGSFGRILCHAFAKAGANVVVNDLGSTHTGDGSSAEPAHILAKELSDLGYSAIADTNSILDAQKIVDVTVKAFGKIDVLINNAGINNFGKFEDLSPEILRRTIEVNALGPLLLCRAVWPIFFAQGYGRIVNIASASVLGMPEFAPYIASKASLVGLTKALALEAGTRNIRVNAVAPISFSRMALGGTTKEEQDAFAKQYPPEGNVAIILALALESCDITGEFFNTGGFRVNRVVFGLLPGIRRAISAEDVLAQKDKIMGTGKPVVEQRSAYTLMEWTMTDDQLA
jgi:NAD(P)-dependent dehydrogenase (short-subunit alcohol dehydrogenase family)